MHSDELELGAIGARLISWHGSQLDRFLPFVVSNSSLRKLWVFRQRRVKMSVSASQYVNVFLTTFPGLGQPPTFNIVCRSTTANSELLKTIRERLPSIDCHLIVSTFDGKALVPACSPISSLLSDAGSNFIQLRLSVPLCGGKGGFGSQLRAAGGRMSSKKKRAQGENNGSNRNLDGRRLRTINEAKALAEYLAIKPEMDKKQREERKKRWEHVLDATEQREHELRNGSKGKVDGKWVEDKEEAGERTREVVSAAMKAGLYHDPLPKAGRAAVSLVPANAVNNINGLDAHSEEISNTERKKVDCSPRSYMGFDQDEDVSSSEDEEQTIHHEASDI